MRKEDVPQDKSDLANAGFRELCYATDEQGNYLTENSSGWAPKTAALDNAIQQIQQRIDEVAHRVKAGKTSPIEYYMEVSKMDVAILASYVGLWQWRVKRHFNPKRFSKLDQGLLTKYARAFGVTVEQLQHPELNA